MVEQCLEKRSEFYLEYMTLSSVKWLNVTWKNNIILYFEYVTLSSVKWLNATRKKNIILYLSNMWRYPLLSD